MLVLKRSKGSLTIEATIAFSIFIFFMYTLLIFVQFAMVNLTLDNATRETARIIAASSYPISFINEMEDEYYKVATEAAKPNRVSGITSKLNEETIFNLLFPSEKDSDSEFSFEYLESLLKGNLSSVYDNVKDDMRDVLIDRLFIPLAESFMDSIKYKIVSNIFMNINESSLVKIDEDRLTFNIVEFPQSKSRYDETKNAFTEFGLEGDTDFNKDDVIISIEYEYPINIPFFPTYEIKLRYTAVEKGWIHGGNGVYTNNVEKINIGEISDVEIVYITRTGKKYHLKDCIHLRLSKIAIPKEEAKEKGYGFCMLCEKK